MPQDVQRFQNMEYYKHELDAPPPQEMPGNMPEETAMPDLEAHHQAKGTPGLDLHELPVAPKSPLQAAN